jgi:putative phosphoesterase
LDDKIKFNTLAEEKGLNMKLGIISDTHDNIWRLDEAKPHLRQVEYVIHCGDLIAPFMIHRLGQGLSGVPVSIVWGNNDGDRAAVAKTAQEYPEITIHGEYAELTLSGLRIAVNHYPDVCRGLAASSSFDLVCYGHDHTAHQEMIGETLLLNPGEIMGLNGRSSFVILETATREIDAIELWQAAG